MLSERKRKEEEKKSKQKVFFYKENQKMIVLIFVILKGFYFSDNYSLFFICFFFHHSLPSVSSFSVAAISFTLVTNIDIDQITLLFQNCLFATRPIISLLSCLSLFLFFECLIDYKMSITFDILLRFAIPLYIYMPVHGGGLLIDYIKVALVGLSLFANSFFHFFF